MKRRAGIALAALLLWLIFGLIDAWGFVTVPFALVYYIFLADEDLRDSVGRFGKTLDQAANVLVLNGHHKETISSHVGRRYLAYRAGGYALTWQDRFVWWLTTKFEDEHPIRAIEHAIEEAGIPL